MSLDNVYDIVLFLVGYAITLGITYFVAWDVPWLLILSGMYLLGIAVSWAWDKWTGYETVYSFLVTIVAYVLGAYLLLGGQTYHVLMGKWCGIPPCVPLVWPLFVLLVGNGVYFLRPYFNKLAQK